MKRPVGQEFDAYDEEMKKYMMNNERGTIRPVKDKEGNTMKVSASV